MAVEAAKTNVKAARAVFLADGWPTKVKAGRRKFDAIVSNPPVHKGQCDDLRVVWALLEGGAARLAAGGVLWVVAQCHVPVGALAAAAHGYASIKPLRAEGGRFIVWRMEAACDASLQAGQ